MRKFYFGPTDLRLQMACLGSANNVLQRSQFDKDLISTWQHHMTNGHFRYNLEKVEWRELRGDHGFVAQLNPNRASKRRAPQAMLHLEQPFCKDKFNFTWVDMAKEGIFELNDSQEVTSNARNVIIINVSPFELGASLLVPSLEDCLPQVLTEHSIRLALKTVLLSGVKNFKAAFNSLCAYASVNHLHWHLYYLQGHSLKLETLPARRLAGNCFELEEASYPAPAFVFQARDVSELSSTAAAVHKLTAFLNKEDIGHNVFVTRGSRLDGKGENDPIDTLRVFVWARNKIVGSKDAGAFVMAVVELAGQMLCYNEERFSALTEKEMVAAQKVTCVDVMKSIRSQVKDLFSKR